MLVNFQHVGLTITVEADILAFYRDILGMDIQKEFTLKQDLARQIFRQEHAIRVVAGTIGNCFIELFLAKERPEAVWNHICFGTDNRLALIAACRGKNYPVTIIESEPFDIVFISDKSGNRFEIKQS
ncbi:MAG TPA: hypothetical protein ENN20_08590 [Candidatus Marinimicrobia bacterium]|nr:hypothetical protein [Candidatus Neomarinimicrobiota bacterium]